MRIALWNNLPSGGGKRALFEMARGLKARGHQLVSWCAPTAARDYLPLAELMPERVVELTPLPRKRWHRLLPGRIGFGRHYAVVERHCRQCAEEIDAGGFDVCLAANCVQTAVPSIGRFLRTPAVHYCQELWRALHEAELGTVVESAAERLVRTYWTQWQIVREREDLASYGRVLVNSFYSRESLLRAHGRDASVCYLGIDATRFTPGAEKRTRTVVGLGALQRHKDPLTAILAVATIPAAERPELVWIGNTIDRAYLTELRDSAVRSGVVFTLRQMIGDAELVAELGRAAAMIYTSKLEPFGFAPLEANACETPVVAIAEGGVRETVRDGFNGLLVGSRDPAALGTALRRVLGDAELARELGRCGRAEVLERWTWAACAERLEAALTRVVQ